MTLSETLIIMNRARVEYENERRQEPAAFTQLFEHCSRFGKYRTDTATRDARAALEHLDVPVAVKVYVADLLPTTSEEAKALAPQLNAVPDDQLQRVLDDLVACSRRGDAM